MAENIPAVGATDDERLKGALAYVFGFITGIIVLLIGENNKFLKFHAMQSIVSSVVICIIFFIIDIILSITVIGICLVPIISLVIWLYFLYGAYMVYSGKPFRMPFFADFVEKNLVK